MMTLDQARAFVAQVTPEDRREDFFPHAGFAERYAAAGDAERAQLVEAMTALLEDGGPSERALAANFFGDVGPPLALLERVAREYVARGWDSSHPAAALLGNSWPLLADDDAAVLRGAFLGDPARHLRIAQAVVAHDPTGPSWDALAALVARSDDPETLLLAFKGAFAAQREADYHALLRGKPAEAVRAVARQLSPGTAARLLAATGLGA